MRHVALAVFLLASSFCTFAEESASAIDVELEVLGDSDGRIATRVTFRYPSPGEVGGDSQLFLQGSFVQEDVVLRNFRYTVPPAGNSVTAVQMFAAGEAEVDVRLVMRYEDTPPVIIARTTKKFPISPAGKTYIASIEDGAEAMFAEGLVPETVGAVKIRPPRRDVAPNLFVVTVDVLPPVTRVEFWVEGKKVMARNAPPYEAELDLGNLPKRVEVRAVGLDARGQYVDADAFVVNERESELELKITRTDTPDGVTHFKLSLQNPKNRDIQSVVLYAGDEKLIEWTQQPYAFDIPTARLAGHEFVRAAALDDTGYEASDLVFLGGERYIEEIEVHVVELPVSVSDRGGMPIADLKQTDFTVLEDGKPQTITSFNFAANLPISVGVLLDHSGSMVKRMEDAKTAAAAFFRSIIRKGDRAFIAPFAADPSKDVPFVSHVATLEAQVGAIPQAGGGTSLYDAVVTGLYRFRSVQGRKALIIISDGDDTTSRLTYDDMLTYARSARVPLYFIGIGMRMGGGAMRSMAEETGGVAYFIRDTKQLPETYRLLEDDLRSQYLLSYRTESSVKDQDYREVEVRVSRQDARVRTIRGFIP